MRDLTRSPTWHWNLNNSRNQIQSRNGPKIFQASHSFLRVRVSELNQRDHSLWDFSRDLLILALILGILISGLEYWDVKFAFFLFFLRLCYTAKNKTFKNYASRICKKLSSSLKVSTVGGVRKCFLFYKSAGANQFLHCHSPVAPLG